MATQQSFRASISAVGDELVQQYELMRVIRRFEETAHERFQTREVPGPLHLSIGQEAVAVGSCWHLRDDDAIVSTHRGHHHCLAKGARPDRLLAELLGRQDGYCRGRGGSMHVAIPEIGLLGTNGIVGGGIPIATGAAFGFQVQERPNVVVCFFGEGAAATGEFGQALNISALWTLPIVFVCENNQYVELGPQRYHVAGDIWRRAEGYGMRGEHVDGNDVEATSAAMAEAIDRARRGEGPTLVEALTYRWFGHYAGDKAAYREEEEVTEWRAKDPLVYTRGHIDETAADEADERAEAIVASALEFALASPLGSEESIYLDVYGE
jgi:TPP-dependent pyruvate/acetoin dehydrogenase alpha subunit